MARQPARFDYSGCRMGRAVAQALDDDCFVDDFDWEFVSQDGLAVKDAWAMATTWASSLLQGHVTVRDDHSDFDYRSPTPFAVAPNYEWVEFCLGCCDQEGRADERAVAARASSLVWRALAACRGYGHQENALFWRRLFAKLQTQRDGDGDGGKETCDEPWDEEWKQMADDHRFFDSVMFPRFTLKLSGRSGPAAMDRMARVFVGLVTIDDSKMWSVETARKLNQILTKLAPLIQPERPSVSRPVELALRFDMRQTNEARMNALIDAIHAHTHQSPASESGRDWGAVNVLVAQLFLVDCVAIGDHFGEESIEWHLRTSLATKVVFSTLHETQEDRTAYCDFVRWALRVGMDNSTSFDSVCRDSAGVRHLQCRRDGEWYGIPAICSALPHTQSLQSFQIKSARMHNESINKRVVAWLGYALFHPDSKSSTWRQLSLNQIFYRYVARDAFRANAVLEMMAKGNNLLVALQGADPPVVVTDAYYTATIRAGAVIRDQPGDDAAVVQILAGSTHMDACVATTDVAHLKEWVFVVLIGYGEAYVRAGWIDQIVARPPGQPFLTGLQFIRCSFDNMELSNLLETAGAELTYLSLQGFSSRVSVVNEFLPLLEQACPHLKSLTFPCPSTAILPTLRLPLQLQELWVVFTWSIKPHEFCLTSSSFVQLRDLVTLRLTTVRPPSENDVHEFIVPLLRGFPQLQRFFWNDRPQSNDADLEKTPLTYEKRRFITRALLDGIQWGRDEFALCGDRTPTATLVALDSVVKYSSRSDHDGGGGTSAMGRLDKQLVVLIGGFLGTRRPRDLWVTGRRNGKAIRLPARS